MALSVFLAVLCAMLVGGGVLQAVSARRLRSGNRALEERVRRYRLALTAGGDELWQYDLSTDRLSREIQMPELASADAESYVPLGNFLESVHPDDRHLIEGAMQAMASGKTDVFEVSYRAQRRDGSWAWLDSYARVAARDPSGKPPVVVGTTRNVTALRTTAERLKLALSSASEEVWEVDFVTDRLHRENPIAEIENDNYRSARQEFARLIHPDDVPLVRQAFIAVRSGKTSDFHALYRLRTKSGHYVWMESQACTTDFDADGKPRRLVGMSRDVTALKESQDRLRLVLWGSDMELWDTDMTTGAIHRNNLIPDLTINASGDTILFSALLAAVHPDDEPTLRQSVYAHAKGLTNAHEAWFRLATVSGAWRWVYVRGRVIERAESGWATRMAGIMHDVTSVKQTEEELKRLNEDLEDRVASRTAALSLANTELSQSIERLGEARTRLVESEKMASLGSLVAGVAHEINTPIGVSVTAASHLDEEIQRFEARLAASAPDAGQLRKSAGIIRQCADLIMRNLDRADKLVKNFKQVAVDQSSEQIREIVLKDYFDEILTSLNPRLKRSAHRIELDCPATIRMVTYPGAIYQVFTNLIINSLIHGFDGIESGVVNIRAREDGENVLLEYRDNGHGMTQEIRRRVFDPFFTTRRGQGGTGLGMHITYNLITQLLCGNIRCESAPGGGVMFEIRIPRRLRVQPAGSESTRAD